MFIRKKKYPSGNIGVIVAEKVNGRMRELHTVGIATDKEGLEPLIAQGQELVFFMVLDVSEIHCKVTKKS